VSKTEPANLPEAVQPVARCFQSVMCFAERCRLVEYCSFAVCCYQSEACSVTRCLAAQFGLEEHSALRAEMMGWFAAFPATARPPILALPVD
jgi:hypothetical protein